MKRLVRDLAFDHLNIFFNNDVSNEAIKVWIENHLELGDFKLNEAHSCTVTQFGTDITIRGDEDWVLLTIETIRPEKI
jgi:hypothetical protein